MDVDSGPWGTHSLTQGRATANGLESPRGAGWTVSTASWKAEGRLHRQEACSGAENLGHIRWNAQSRQTKHIPENVRAGDITRWQRHNTEIRQAAIMSWADLKALTNMARMGAEEERKNSLDMVRIFKRPKTTS